MNCSTLRERAAGSPPSTSQVSLATAAEARRRNAAVFADVLFTHAPVADVQVLTCIKLPRDSGKERPTGAPASRCASRREEGMAFCSELGCEGVKRGLPHNPTHPRPHRTQHTRMPPTHATAYTHATTYTHVHRHSHTCCSGRVEQALAG